MYPNHKGLFASKVKGETEDKRFIAQIVLSNTSYYDGKLDVELHPAFDTLFRLSYEYALNNSTIEHTETQSECTKKAPEGANLINGGNDEARLGFAPRSQSFALTALPQYAQSVRYPDLFALLTPSVRKYAELAKSISHHWHSKIKKPLSKLVAF